MKLEELIKSNAATFEDMPSNAVWQRIDNELKTNTKPSFWISKKFRVFAGAAVLFCCIGLGYLIGSKANKSQSYAENMPEIAKQNAEFLMFTQNLDEKKSVFNKLLSEQPELEKVFARDLNTLDQDYQALKSQIQVSPNKEQLLNAMIENLRFQEQILNTQTRILEKTNKNKNLDIL
jgi:septal ring factor EnvC (AmiA/AmiB activator)